MITTKRKLEYVRKQADRLLNPGGNVGNVFVCDHALYIEVRDATFGNFVDSNSMTTMLKEFKDEGIVDRHVHTMWVGQFEFFSKRSTYVWCTGFIG